MLICDQLVFVELQKTGSTHIKWLLGTMVGGVSDGKHNVPTPELLASGRHFIGSVRSPWAWYVSLWTYGCEGKGTLRSRLLDYTSASSVAERAAKRAAGKLPPDDGQLRELNSRFTPAQWYSDPANVEHFRDWLQVVLDPRMRLIVEKPFFKAAVGALGGLLTYRYFHLFVKGAGDLPPRVDNLDKLKRFEEKNLLMHHIINQSRLAEDLITALEASGVRLSDANKDYIRTAKPRNTSTRPRTLAEYYDQTCIDLVAERDRFIIEKYGYTPPAIG